MFLGDVMSTSSPTMNSMPLSVALGSFFAFSSASSVTLLMVYFSGGSRAENSPVSESVRMLMKHEASPPSVQARLFTATVSLCQVRVVVTREMWSSAQLNENDSLFRRNWMVAMPMLFFDSPKPTASVSLRSPPATRPTKRVSVLSAKS